MENSQEKIINLIWRDYSKVFTQNFAIQVYKENVVEISLANNDMKTIPESLCKLLQQLTYLEYLNLSGNILTELSLGICNITTLIRLNLGFNSLYFLPPEIIRLKNLQILELIHNLFIDLPPSVCQLVQLQELNLYNNNLVTLPESIENLKHLQKINISNNFRFYRLPWSCRLLHLQLLEMRGIDFFHIEPETAMMLRLNFYGIVRPADWRTDYDGFHNIWDDPQKKSDFFEFIRKFVQNQTTQEEEKKWKFDPAMPRYEEIASWLEPLCRQTKGPRAQVLLECIEKALDRKHIPVPASKNQILL